MVCERFVMAAAIGAALLAAIVSAQAPQTLPRRPAPEPWRGAGTRPCVGPEGGALQCPAAPRTIAVRAGRLFDSVSGQMLTKQVVILEGERITDVGAETQVRIPQGAQVIDLSQATVMPGLIDAHTHMFNNRTPKMSTERAMLIAINNLQADLHAGFTAARDMSTHGNGYADVEIRNAINQGDIDGPRYQVSGRGIAWGPNPPNPTAPDNPLNSIIIRSIDEARAAVREPVDHNVDWIKLYPTGGYTFDAAGVPKYVLMYPEPVLRALIDEAHRLGKKTGCHNFGGDGLQFAIDAGCDTIEHGYSLTQAQLDTMVKKNLFF